jgi:hypothetical protein
MTQKMKADERYRDDAFLKALAMDAVDGKIFTSGMIERQEDVGMVFMPLLLMSQETRDEWLKAGPTIIYEYLDKAEPRSINGMPIFFSFSYLNKPDAEKFAEFARAYAKVKEEFQGGNEDCEPIKDIADAG